MGCNTYISIPEKYRPLPERMNIVCTRSHVDELKDVDGIHVCTDVNGLLSKIHSDYIGDSEWWEVGDISFRDIETLFIIGGEIIYRDTIMYSNNIYLNHILAKTVEGEGYKYFPMKELANGFVFEKSGDLRVSKSGIPYVFKYYTNKKSEVSPK